MEELPLELRFPPVQPKPLNDDLPQPWASVPGEVEEPPQEEQAEEMVEQSAETEDEVVKECGMGDERKFLNLSALLEESFKAMNFSEEYIRKVYQTAVSEANKLEDKINNLREKLISKRELIDEISENFDFVKVAKDNLSDYAQLELGLVFDEEPTKTSAEAQEDPVEPEACAEIAEAVPAEELSEPPEPAREEELFIEIPFRRERLELIEPEEELSESEKALNEVIDALDGATGDDEDVPF